MRVLSNCQLVGVASVSVVGGEETKCVDSQLCRIPDSSQEPTEILLHTELRVWSDVFFSAENERETTSGLNVVSKNTTQIFHFLSTKTKAHLYTVNYSPSWNSFMKNFIIWVGRLQDFISPLIGGLRRTDEKWDSARNLSKANFPAGSSSNSSSTDMHPSKICSSTTLQHNNSISSRDQFKAILKHTQRIMVNSWFPRFPFLAKTITFNVKSNRNFL